MIRLSRDWKPCLVAASKMAGKVMNSDEVFVSFHYLFPASFQIYYSI